jgi:membrane protease YdiL (CAAX protease family)
MISIELTHRYSEKRDFFLIFLPIFLAIPFRLVIGYFYNPFPTWATNTIQLGTYLILCVLVWIHRDNLQQYQISKSTVWILILSGTLFRLGNPFPVEIIFWVIGVSWLVLYLRNTFHFTPRPDRIFWFSISCIIGIGLPIIVSCLVFLFKPDVTSIFRPWPGLFAGCLHFLFQISHVSIFEELTFRGFLWGYLAKKGWGEKSILFFTTILFWAAHLFYINDPFTFWLVVPIMGFVLGYIKWRSQSVSYSILVHALYNTMSLFV